VTPRTFHEPWKSFLQDLDDLLSTETELHCLGGFVISQAYGLERPTADVDIIAAFGTAPVTLASLAGRDSDLHKRHRVYLDIVTVGDVPENYAERLVDMPSQGFHHLRLRGFERYDLLLAKLVRNDDRDREDLRRIVATAGLAPVVLRDRYIAELRPILRNPRREDLTLKLWIEIIEEVNARRPS